MSAGESGDEKTSQHNKTGKTEDQAAVVVEAIAEGSDEEDGYQIHDPDWREEE
jgi:hypothetical protein